MKRIPLFFALATIVQSSIFAQTYQHVSIRQVQEVADSILMSPTPNTASAYLSDTVWVKGVVATAPRLPSGVAQWFTGDRWRFVMKDPSDSIFNYITVVASDTLFFRDSVGLDLLAAGDSVEILGVITEYRQLTQLEVLRVSNGMNLIGTSTHVDAPRTVPLSDLFAGEVFKWTPGEKYESGFLRLENLTVVGVNGWEFSVADAQGNQMIIDDQSNLIFGVDPPAAGAKIDWVQGYVFTNSSLAWTLNPRSTADIQVGVYAPSVGPISRSIRKPGPTDAVVLASTVIDEDGTVASVTAYYSINGAPSVGVALSMGASNVWSGTIPSAGVDSAFVTVYFIATDNLGNEAIFPADTTKNRYFYFSLNRQPSIAEVQYNPYGGGSSYVGDTVTVRGIATSDRRDYGAIFLQQPGTAWSGLRVSSVGDSIVRRGDDISAMGVVAESFGLTILNNSTLTVHSSGNALPTAVSVLSSDVKTGGTMAEAYESVLIQVSNVFVVNINEDAPSNSDFGEFGLSESYGATTGLRVDDLSRNLPYTNNTSRTGQETKTQLHVKDKFASVRGILDYSFSNFKLLPRDTADFSGYESVGTGVEVISEIPGAYALSQNYPNPFNPTTVIEYSIGQTGNVSLELFNVLGQRVASLVNGQQAAGTYRISVGPDTFRNLSTGMYFYVLRSGSFSQTRRMVFLK